MRYMIHVVTLTAGESAEINGMGVNGSSTVCVKCAEMVGAFGMLMSLVRYQMRGVAEVYQGARKGNDNLPGPSQKSNVTPQGMESSESIETCAQTGSGSHPDLQSVGGYLLYQVHIKLSSDVKNKMKSCITIY